jgi:lysozyme
MGIKVVAPNTKVVAGTMGAITAGLLAFMAQFEGTRYVPYVDPAVPGLLTVCRGITNRAAPGWVVAGKKYTEQECVDKEVELLEKVFSPPLAAMLKVDVTQRQWEMLLDFEWNEGINNLRTSTLMKKLNAGDCLGAAAEFDNWIKAGGVRLKGLANRRDAEQGEFIKYCVRGH